MVCGMGDKWKVGKGPGQSGGGTTLQSTGVISQHGKNISESVLNIMKKNQAEMLKVVGREVDATFKRTYEEIDQTLKDEYSILRRKLTFPGDYAVRRLGPPPMKPPSTPPPVSMAKPKPVSECKDFAADMQTKFGNDFIHHLQDSLTQLVQTGSAELQAAIVVAAMKGLGGTSSSSGNSSSSPQQQPATKEEQIVPVEEVGNAVRDAAEAPKVEAKDPMEIDEGAGKPVKDEEDEDVPPPPNYPPPDEDRDEQKEKQSVKAGPKNKLVASRCA